MPVLDASALVEYLAGGTHAGAVRARIMQTDDALCAPHLIDAEIGHVLWRAARTGELSPARARAALDDLSLLPLERAAHVGLLPRAWDLRRNLSFYDALYVALAEALGMRLVTLDARLAGAGGIRADVDLIA